MRRISTLLSDRNGAALVEFALVLPLFVCLLYGIMGYGQYFLLAHSVQQIANDAARATIAGTSPDERRTIAADCIAREVATLGTMRPAAISSTIDETSSTVTVRVRLDASNVPLFRTMLLPMPDPLIERRAVVRPGGIA